MSSFIGDQLNYYPKNKGEAGYYPGKNVKESNREQVDDLDDDPTIQTDSGVRLGLKSIENDADNRSPETARFALAESGESDDEATMDTELKQASTAMELALVHDAMKITQLKLDAGRNPNELLGHVMEEMQAVDDEIDSLLEDPDQGTMLKDAEMRKKKLVAQMRMLQTKLEEIQA